ncbi:MAG: hypothetical protein Q7J72_03055 [Candidatus Omnitrophota bacterium]|nr:hypothetical protein [Candidatus Omnitrophota bacterium]
MVKSRVESLISIRKRFPKEWILLANYEFDKMNRLSKGAVIAHSKKRDTIYREQMKYKEPLAIDYTGPIPKDLVVMF